MVVESHPKAPRRRITRLAATIAALAIVSTTFATTGGAAAPERRASQAGGGEITFGLEAETSLGFCLPSAQLAISGIQVVAAIYDTLVVPNSKGEYVPYLAQSVEPNADFTEWTIGLREGVTFHDGTPVDAEAIKLNLDSYAGKNPDQSAPLFSALIGAYFESSEVVDPLTVKVVLSRPVHDYPGALYATGRLGMMAPAQIGADDCSTNMIGSGPFTLTEWNQNESMVVEANPDYWQKGYPKADKITFIPQPDAPQRITALQGGELDMLHTSSGIQIARLRGLGDQFDLLTQKPGFREIRYYFVNASKPPFDNPEAREALALALNRDEINEIQNQGVFEVANSIMDRKVPGYEKNAGYPKFNLKKAKALVAKVEADSGPITVTLLTTNDTENAREAQTIAQQIEKAGMTADIQQVDQAALIGQALGGNFGIFLWRNLHGGSQHPDFDTYSWFGLTEAGTPYLTNFGRITDTDLQALFDEGRGESDINEIERIYKGVNERIAEIVGLIPVWYVDWTIASTPGVKVTLPKLPDGGGKPLFLYGRIPVLGLTKK